jgi:glycosyltransferase involved in cell wall biosynthesis
VFVTAEERDHSLVPAGVARERRHVVPLPVRMPGEECAGAEFRRAVRARFGVPEGAPCIVFMGRLHPVKRVEMVLKAAAVLSRGLPEVRVLLVGGGEEPYVRGLRELAGSLGIAGRVLFAGWVRGEEKWAALAAGDVLTLNSLHENFGFVAVEALCVGTLPVLTGNLAIAAELGAAGVGIVAEPSAESLAAAWGRAIERNRAEPVAARGRVWVRENLSLEAVGMRLEGLYRAVLGGKGA